MQSLTNASLLEIFPSLLDNLRLDFLPSFHLRRSVKDETRSTGNEVDPTELLLQLQSNFKNILSKQNLLDKISISYTLISRHNPSANFNLTPSFFPENFVSQNRQSLRR